MNTLKNVTSLVPFIYKNKRIHQQFIINGIVTTNISGMKAFESLFNSRLCDDTRTFMKDEPPDTRTSLMTLTLITVSA